MKENYPTKRLSVQIVNSTTINDTLKDNKLSVKVIKSSLINNALQNDLSKFIEKTFCTVDSGNEYLHNWHIDCIAEYLNECYDGNIKRLIVNIPPRSLKSISVSVAFPAWILGRNPSERIIVATYSEFLSIKHSTDCRLVVNSQWFKDIFPEFKLNAKQNEKKKFATTKNGYRFATSVGGTLTGEGGNVLIVDDPHNPQQAMSNKYRNKTIEWFKNTFSSRLNDKKKGVIIVVMQRLHENDLSGYLLQKTCGWEQLNLPAIAEKNQFISIGKFLKKRQKGELLHFKREGEEEIERAKIELGSFVFAAQYQQNPVVQTGGMIKPIWFKRYDYNFYHLTTQQAQGENTKNDNLNFKSITLSFDTAIKVGIKNNPTVCSVWGEKKNNYYLLNIYRDWWEYPELRKKSIELIKVWKADTVLIEDKASGQSLIQDLRKDLKVPIIAIKVTKDKITRLASVSSLIEAGRVFLPVEAPWLADFEHEVYLFPNGEHDDQVDSMSQYLYWIKTRPEEALKENHFRVRRL
ncbi:phage terminase large subunit [Pseudomonadota bacterium]